MDNLLLDVITSNEAAAEPVTIEEAKAWLKIDVADDDLLLTELITAARGICESYLNISLIARTVTVFLQIGLDEIRLPYGPVKEITSVTNCKGEPIESYILKYEKFQAIDPETEIKVIYSAGFNGDIPKQFKTAILAQTAWLYTNRGDEQNTEKISPIAKNIMAAYRRVT